MCVQSAERWNMSSSGSGNGKRGVYSKTNGSWRAVAQILGFAACCIGRNVSRLCGLLLLLERLEVEQRCMEMRQLWSIGCEGL
jgi:hypothetical protein